MAASALEGGSLSLGVNPGVVLSPVLLGAGGCRWQHWDISHVPGKGLLTSAVCHRVTAGFAELQGISAGLSGKPETPLLQLSKGVCFGPDGL